MLAAISFLLLTGTSLFTTRAAIDSEIGSQPGMLAALSAANTDSQNYEWIFHESYGSASKMGDRCSTSVNKGASPFFAIATGGPGSGSFEVEGKAETKTSSWTSSVGFMHVAGIGANVDEESGILGGLPTKDITVTVWVKIRTMGKKLAGACFCSF